MTKEGDPSEPIVSPDEMLSDEQRKKLEKDSIKPLLNGVWAERLIDGQNLTVGGSVIDSKTRTELHLDFKAFDPKLASLTPDVLEARFEQNRASLELWLKSVEQSTTRKINIDPYLFYCLQQVQGTILALLNHDPQNPPSESERRQIYQKPDPKLSELVGKSYCAEMAALGQYALQKAGIDSAYVGGIAMSDPNDEDEYAEAHSFIVLKDAEGHGRYIFDIARPGQHNLPTVLESSMDFDYDVMQGKDEKLIESSEVLLGDKRYFGVGEQVAGRHNVIG